MGLRGPCWPLPSLSSWQMKGPKQSSPALSNAPGTPCPDPPTASLRGQRGGLLRLQGRRCRACFSSPGPRRVADPRPAARRAVGPGRGRVWCGEVGVRPLWPRTSLSGNPLPHSLSLQLCRGLANGKRKLGQRKRRQAPRLKNPDKRRGPPAPAAQPPGVWHRRPGRCPLPWQPCERPGPMPTSLLPTPLSRAALALAPSPARQQPMFPAGVPALSAPCAPGCARRARAPRPRPCRQLPGRAWSRPLPWPSALTWGGRGSGRGGIPTRQKATPFIGRQRQLCGQGTAGGAGWDPRGAGPEGAGPSLGASSPGPAPFAPPAALPSGRAGRCSLRQQTREEG